MCGGVLDPRYWNSWTASIELQSSHIHWDDCSSIEAFQEFKYLGSIVERSGRADSEVAWEESDAGIESFWLSP